MPVVRRIRNRGATITVESHAEILFMPNGQVHNWANRFVGRIRAATIAEAPTNKRPRWGHYGKPLKSTIVSARPRFWSNGRDRQRVYGAVGSTAPYAYYVDQGTGIHAGHSPYPAKVLPPWHRGSPSLYEHTWRPGGPGDQRVKPVMIKGQKGQKFFDKGLARAFQSMRLRAYQVPSEPKISDVGDSVANGLLGFLGNTPSNGAFRASLTEWRSWRDAAWRGDPGPWGHEGIVRRRNVRVYEQAQAAKARAKAGPRKPTGAEQYRATKAAASKRAKAQREALRKTREAKALGKQRAAEREAAAVLETNKRHARNLAVAFGKKQSAKGRSVSGGWVVDPNTGLISGFRVTWTTKGGKSKSRIFDV